MRVADLCLLANADVLVQTGLALGVYAFDLIQLYFFVLVVFLLRFCLDAVLPVQVFSFWASFGNGGVAAMPVPSKSAVCSVGPPFQWLLIYDVPYCSRCHFLVSFF